MRIGDVEQVGATDLVVEMEGLLRYAGDSGAGPSDAVVRSRALSDVLSELKDGISEWAAQAKTIHRFEFEVGHPAYPVFWDFAYAFCTGGVTTILVGSSSD